jgi:transcription elongation GreA/GreB family factor
MSRAFVSEAAAEASAAALPERPVSAAPNLVTRRGLDLIDAQVTRLQKLLDGSTPDDPRRAALARDLRYWRARRGSAQVITPAAASAEVAFGTQVTIRRGDLVSVYRVVGEDEADPPGGLLSWTSPLAQSLMGARKGDIVEVGGGRAPVSVEAVEHGPDA